MMVCQRCKVGWRLLPEDKYCGFCGQQARALTLSTEPPYFYEGAFVEDPKLIVKNTGSTVLHLEAIECDGTWTIEESAASCFIEPGSDLSFSLTLNEPLCNGKHSSIRIQTHENHEAFEISIPVYATPEFVQAPSPILITTEPGQKQDQDQVIQTFEVSWTLGQVPIYLQEINSRNNWWKIRNLPPEKRLSAGDTLTLEVECDPQKTPLSEGKIQAEAELVLKGLNESLLLSFPALLQRRPRLKIRELINSQNELKLPSHLQQTPLMHLEVEVYGEKGFEVNDVVCRASDSGPAGVIQSTFPMESLKRKNATGEMSWYVEVPFFLRRGGRKSHNKNDQYQYDVFFEVKCEPYGILRETLSVTVISPEQYLVALDFGTSNSCCASVNLSKGAKDKRVEIVRYKGRYDIVPTWSFYETPLAEDSFEYEIGIDAKTKQGRAGHRVERHNFVQSIKRKVGVSKPLRMRFSSDERTYQIRPKQIIKDYIKRMLRMVSEQGEVVKVALTHPTRFSEFQIQELREVLEELGFSGKEMLLDEASAVAFYHIYTMMNHNRKDFQAWFTETPKVQFVVYDFGGGTTDITISEVSFDESRTLTMKTKAMGGLKELGGEDITEQLVHDVILCELKKSIKAQLSRELELSSDLNIPYAKPAERNTLGDVRLQDQSIRIYDAAERLKKDLSSRERTSLKGSFVIYFESNGTLKEKPMTIDLDLRFTKEDFEKLIRPTLSHGCNYLKSLLDGHGLELCSHDLLLLAGQSSQIPLLKTMMDETFSCRVEAISREKLKQSVALGACEYANFHVSNSKQIRLESFHGVTRFSYAILKKDLWFGDTLFEIVKCSSELDTYYPIEPLPSGTQVEIYQNATPWITAIDDCDADLIGTLHTAGEIFDSLELEHCDWFIFVDRLERISLVVRQKDPVTQQMTREEHFQCNLVHY